MILASSFGELSICICRYPFYPVNVIGGVSGIYLCYYFSYYVSNITILKKFLALIGMYSMTVLCMHGIQVKYNIFTDAKSTVQLVSMLVLPLLLTYIIVNVKFLKKLFC